MKLNNKKLLFEYGEPIQGEVYMMSYKFLQKQKNYQPAVYKKDGDRYWIYARRVLAIPVGDEPVTIGYQL